MVPQPRLKYNTADVCQNCGLSLRAHHFTDKFCYWEHHTVKLVEGFEKHDAQAAKGPLPPNRLGTIVAIDMRPGAYDVKKPYKVEYKGQTWWYARKALQPATLDDVPPELPDDAQAAADSLPAPAPASAPAKLDGAHDSEAQERIRCWLPLAMRALEI
jgi:hypothetical protein